MTLTRHRMRARFALRFGKEESVDGEEANRTEQVRTAFNSPFWPFVLATTSVGQEGLDFHQFCHAVVHWNLPANPVDLEQREGRVHRYKGHAVRKNIATRYGLKTAGEHVLLQRVALLLGHDAGERLRWPGGVAVPAPLFQYWAMAVWSAVRVALVAEPSSFTSSNAAVYAAPVTPPVRPAGTGRRSSWRTV